MQTPKTKRVVMQTLNVITQNWHDFSYRYYPSSLKWA